MKNILNSLSLIFIVLFFCACSAKDVKDMGSSASSSGALGLIVGGTLYGIGSLMEKNEKPSLEDKEKYGNLYTEKSVNNYESKLNECIKSKGINDFSAQDGNQWNREDIKSQLEDCHLKIKNGEEKFENS